MNNLSNPQKIILTASLVVMLSVLLVLVFGDNGMMELSRLKATKRQLVETNAGLTKENMQLYRAIDRLQNDPVFVENVARRELGMIRSDEIIFTFGPVAGNQ